MSTPKQDLSDRWIQHQREKTKRTQTWACISCPNRRIFAAEEDLWARATEDHVQELEARDEDIEIVRKEYGSQSAQKRPMKENRRPKSGGSNREGPPQQIKRALDEAPGRPPQPPTRSTLGISALDISTLPRPSEDVVMQDISDDSQAAEGDRPPKRAATGDGISAGSRSPLRDSSPSSSPRWSKARPTSGRFDSSGSESSSLWPLTSKRQLWQEGQLGPTKASFQDPSNIASIAAQKARAQQHCPKPRKPFQPPPPSLQSQRLQLPPNIPPPLTQTNPALDSYEIVLQPETRPISQEQLVAEVKGIYAGLVMVEAKCIEVDKKQAALAQADPGSQPKLNNEQWQALIALHRTLLHEHHDFFLASQHPSASPALRRLASKYAMPATMWRHGIHSFLELLRHRLPASLDHMLAFIYLAYSMMALLYDTVPAFEDTWIECLGDLGRYRMAIEDDDIRDREVWTGVARHWYSKASDKAPTTRRLYHHLAILARPNALQQLFDYSKSFCTVIPFISARESISTLFDPVLPAEIRAPPLGISFVEAHRLVFQNRSTTRSRITMEECFAFLSNSNEKSTCQWKAPRYDIEVANWVAKQPPADNISMPFSLSKSLEQSSFDNQPQSPLDVLGSHLDPCHDATQNRDRSRHCTTSDSNIVVDNASLLVYNSGRVSWIFRKLQRFLCYIKVVILLNLCEHIGTVAASGTAVKEKSIKRIFQPLLEREAVELASMLTICIGATESLQRWWDIDAWLLLNVFLHAGIPFLAPDSAFSNTEMLVLCGYSTGTNIHWMKKKLRKLSKTRGITALFITALSLYSGWEFAHQIPGLESRFDNKCIPRAIASVPSAAVCSMVWYGAVEQTRLAATIEAHIDDPRLWRFLLRILRTFLLQFFSRGIQVSVDRFFSRFDAGFQNNPLQRLVQDVEGDPRALWNEPVRAPGNDNDLFWEPEEIEEEPGEFIPRHNQFRGHRNEDNVFHRPRDMEAYPRAYIPRNDPSLGPDGQSDQNLHGLETRRSPRNENFDRQQSEDDYDDNGSDQQENENGIYGREESPLRI
ncbi:hypothetical protein V8E51_009294 [Hyaloscypha variabilis]